MSLPVAKTENDLLSSELQLFGRASNLAPAIVTQKALRIASEFSYSCMTLQTQNQDSPRIHTYYLKATLCEYLNVMVFTCTVQDQRLATSVFLLSTYFGRY
jgi:hypothetical protein